MISSGSLQVRPDTVIFRDLEPGESDTVDIWAHNVGSKSINVRFSLPENPFFVLNCKANIHTAPGLEAHATIKYTASTLEKQTCTLKVQCNDSVVDLPLVAYPPTTSVQVGCTKIDFGTVTLHSQQIRSFKFTNYGINEGKYVINCTESCVKLSPASGIINSNQTQEVSVTFKGDSPGDFNFPITVDVENNSEQINPIIITAKVVDQSITLHDPKGDILTELNFQHLFYGQKKIIPIVLKNRGSCVRTFTLKPLRSDVNDDDNYQIFNITPINGTMNAFSDVNLNVTFSPPKKNLFHDTEQQYGALSKIEIAETGQIIEFNVIGTAVKLNYEISSVDFDFGRTVLKSKQSQKFTIKNNSPFLPLPYNIKQVSQVYFNPATFSLKPRESKEISVTFSPSNLGPYNVKTHISFCGGIDRRDVNLSAIVVANSADDSNYQRPEVWDSFSDAEFYMTKPSTQFGLTIQEVQQKKDMRKKFDAYITDSATKRAEVEFQRKIKENATRAAKTLLMKNNNFTSEDFDEYVANAISQSRGEQEDPVSLGLEHCAGMVPPEPPLLKVFEPFKLPETIGLFSTINPRGKQKRRNGAFDDHVLITKKFKPKPTTPAEINECSKKLQQAQQVLVVASHQTINFGSMSVFSVEKRSFNITNNLQQFIFVSMKCNHEELKESGPQSQVVPPHQTCGFDIILHHDTPELFSKQFEYTINNDLTYSVNVNAEIVPIELTVEPEVLHFQFDDGYAQPYIKQFVKLRNNSNSTAEFKWSGFDHVFTLHNHTGVICPHGTYSAEITYKPDSNSHAEAMATVSVVGGPSKKLKMIGDTGRPKLQLSKKVVPFGLIPLNAVQTQELRIKNIGTDDAIFTVTPNLTDVISIIPTGGRIKQKEHVDLQVSVNCEKCGTFEIPINVSICGSQPLGFSITGQAEFPRVELLNEELNFGNVYLGSTHIRKITLRNTGLIPASGFLDLSEIPEFHIEYASELNEASEDDKKNMISVITDPKAMSSSADVTESVSSLSETITNDIGNRGFIYKLKIMEKSSLSFSFIYQPRAVNDYSFDLPLSIVNLEKSSKLSPKVTASALQAPLYPSESAIDFGVTSLFDSENPNSRPPLKQLMLKNEYTKDIQFRFDDSKCKNFTIEPREGYIKYASNATIFISFRATASQPYLSNLPVYVTTDKGEILASEIQLMGVGSCRNFQPSVSYVSLPPVPLNIISERTIYIINSGFIATEIQADMPILEKQFPLSITFPDGTEMKNSTKQLPVHFSFQSPKPMSFSTMVAFVDKLGNTCSVTVSCVTDNSMFTLYPLLTQKCYKLSAGQGKPIAASVYLEDLDVDFIGKYLEIDNFLKFKKINGETTKQTIDFLIKFLNSLVLSTKIKRFPDDIANSNGEMIIEMISNLCGSKKPVSLSNILHTSDKSENSKYASMKNLLSFLLSQGAMLPDIKPEFLLKQNDYSDVMRKKITRQLLGIDYYGAPELSSFDQKILNDFISSPSFTNSLLPHLKAAESLYKTLSTESWMRVILQILKLFMFSKITPEKLIQVPGVQDALAVIKPAVDENFYAEINRSNKSLNGSNFLSSQESMLLKWTSIHYCAQAMKNPDVVIDFLNLHDPKYFLMLLRAHVLNSEIPYIEDIRSPDDTQKNIDTVIRVMNDFKIACIPTNDELSTGNSLIMALSCYQLYELLPHFLPMTTVEFIAPLSGRVVQNITITNPSKVGITYEAKIEGSKNFRALEESVNVGPNETVEFLVEYVARKLDKESAILSLIPGKPKVIAEPPKNDKPQAANRRLPQKKKGSVSEPHVFASTIVVNLVSIVNYEGPMKTFTIEGNIYETKKMTVPVENAIQVPAKMKITNRIFNDSELHDARSKIEELFKNPTKEYYEPGTDQLSLFDQMLKKHQMFLFNRNKVQFENDESVDNLDLEFTPISLGTFHCYVVFYNEKYGEFVYEIIGKSNLPQPILGQINLKAECGETANDRILIDSSNRNLFNAMGYSIAKQATLKTYMSDAKFRESIASHVRELTNLYSNSANPLVFNIEYTSSYFKGPETLRVNKGMGDSNAQNSIPIEFYPEKPGEYPCRIILKSLYDVRVIKINAFGLAACRTMEVEMITASGRSVMQGIPFFNPSELVWHFKTSITGPPSFTCPATFQVQPNTVFDLPISFVTGEIGKYTAELNVVNTDKEATYKYNITADVVDPSAEEKIELELRARQKFSHTMKVRPFVENGVIEVTSNMSMLSFPTTIQIVNGQFAEPFVINAYTVESGITAGTITFTDLATKAYIWYVIELKVDQPEPEEIIEVKTVARKTVTVKIPVHNPKKTEIAFDVTFNEKDFFGDKQMIVKPNATSIYQLVFAPLTQMQRMSEISFYNKEEGEFIYSININVSSPDVCIMAPMQASIGQSQSSFLFLENPMDEKAHFDVSNDNDSCFKVVDGKSIDLEPHEKRQVEVSYIPASVGNKETALIGFRSREIGDFQYRFAGVGKPPQPSSPIIVESMLELSASGQIIFTSPFQHSQRFELTITTDFRDCFKILNKRRFFTLNEYGEHHQIAFSFTPPYAGQFTATIMLTTTGMNPEIRWTYPIIGNTLLGDENTISPLRGKCNTTITNHYEMPLIGEKEEYRTSDYHYSVDFPEGFEFLKSVILIQPEKIVKTDVSPTLHLNLTLQPRRPVQTTCQLIIENPMNQRWRFPIKINVDTGNLTKVMLMEAPLGQEAHEKIVIDEPIRSRCEFEAYFVQGSASEFNVSPDHGFMEPSLLEKNHLPIDVFFKPTTYGKLMKALLVIDTQDTQFLIELNGKVPDYVPPIAPLMGTINATINNSTMRSTRESPRKRNFLKENIEKARMQKPPSVRRARMPFKH
ncbi:hypothetical protein TRFO_31385 [Tritrichomonas foetus]|uniref:Calponin-homology (CH) domain-containing protein n=1 Tax=Tritrichomonas foetus TaxID=1144522 RepID=A0A1J4JSF5_9EUKA|nr:hypothetical protein TRFO_31385 [Tritrichomonas foetus]|eukprot:OHT01690.1 hypothetical protein TRFO_31385 [Tritrichomonas foetus]